MFNFPNTKKIIFISIAFLILAISAAAQTTTFTYQGKLSDASAAQPTNGTYEMQFKAFDAGVGGNQFAATITLPNVQVVNGIFTVALDFGALTFRGQDVFLDVGVRPFGNLNPFTVLVPRQSVTSTPYSIQSLNSLTALHASDSTNLGGLPASNYTQNTDVRLADNRNPLAGSPNYVQNQNALPQVSANFNISGTGSANVFNSATQFNIGGNRVLSVGSGNIFAGISAGAASTTGGDNAFVGTNAGLSNMTGFNNSFFGTDAGRTNTASNNSFFGRSSGYANTTGVSNSFFGQDAGRFNFTGSNNAFFGLSAGSANTTGGDNSFVGARAGSSNLIGGNNSFFGTDAGNSNTASDNSFFGRSAGFANTIGTRNVFFGEDAGRFNLTGSGNSFVGIQAGQNNTTGANNTMIGDSANVGANNLSFATALGSGATVSTSSTVVLGRALDTVVAPNLLQVGTLGGAGATSLCRNSSNQISTCTAGGGQSGINNQTSLQTGANFNIDGNGTAGGAFSANVVNSATNFRISNTPVFGTPSQTSVVAGQNTNFALVASDSAFFGYKSGSAANGFSQANTFIGSNSGTTTTSGGNNSFVGKDTGLFNTSGSLNSFFGSGAGTANTTANANSLFGYESGKLNSTGTRNAFFGFQAGLGNVNVSDNSFFGYQSGLATIGANNAFFGSSAGSANTTGVQNTFVGSSAGSTTVGFSNSLFGYGTSASGNENTVIGGSSGVSGNKNTVVGNNASSSGNNNTIIGNNATIVFRNHSTVIGADAQVNADNTIELGSDTDTVDVPNLMTAKKITVSLGINTGSIIAGFGKFDELRLTNTYLGNTPMCLDAVKRVGVCPAPPIAGGPEVGTTIVADAIKSQQSQIDLQAAQIKKQEETIDALKKLVCASNATAAVCQK